MKSRRASMKNILSGMCPSMFAFAISQDLKLRFLLCVGRYTSGNRAYHQYLYIIAQKDFKNCSVGKGIGSQKTKGYIALHQSIGLPF